MKMTIIQCTVCKEAWPHSTGHIENIGEHHVCCQCKLDKDPPKKFSEENTMIPSHMPEELQNLTQFKEMLIACAFPVMHAFTKPRGEQTAYKGHVITLSQNVQQLANVLPRCPKELPVTVFTLDGKKLDHKIFKCVIRKCMMHCNGLFNSVLCTKMSKSTMRGLNNDQ